MENHVKVIGILWIVSGALGLILAFIIFWVLYGISYIPDVEVGASIILRTIARGVSIFILILSIPDIVGGIWLIKRQEWARILILILAFLNLINFPLGTALGIYSIVILMREETVQLFKA